MTQDKSDGTFRVIDKRLFTEEGELRPEAQGQARREHEETKQTPSAAAAPAASAANAPAAAAEPPAAAATSEAPARSPHFEMLLNLIANQAAAMLGAYADPRTGQAVVDLEGAREFIDMLDALRERTLGNLADEEDRTLTEVLGSLKFTYLEMTKAAATARAGGGGPAPGSRR